MVMYIFPFRARVVCRVIISLGRVRTKLLHVTFTGKFHFDTEDTGRTGVHADANSTPLEGPWTPLHQPSSIHTVLGTCGRTGAAEPD